MYHCHCLGASPHSHRGSVLLSLCVCLLKVDAQLQVVRKLEEKEHLLQSNIGTGEKELGLRTQALEMNKRKVMAACPSELILSACCGWFCEPLKGIGQVGECSV